MTLIQVYIALALLGGVVQDGYAPHYSKGLMDRVSRNRDMPSVPCMVSSPIYPIGTWLWIYGVKTGVLRECRVTDVSADKDRARHIRTKRWVELSWEVTEAICGSTKTQVVDCPVVVIKVDE